ncbi:MAG: MBL fold metallo-hydrolase [Candidatus Kapabacteria bacterium]|nr:MBL fold metallo-hydrolase [Candidatus Kapabacteria bacterium]
MNKKVKIILIGVGIIIGLIGLGIGYFMYKFNSETSKMTPVETGKISENGYAIKDEFVNMFLIKDSTGYIAIDAGKDIEVISKELKKLNINTDKIIAVFLTHSDIDHVAGIPLFTKAKLYMSRNEVKMINGEKQKMPGYNNSISRTDYILLDDNQNVVIGAHKIHCILTEGHTSGSMCYQINEKNLFTGDILSLHDGKLGHSVKFFDLDHDLTTKSISKITNIPNVENILTSHWGISKDYKNAVKDWKE